MRTVTLTDEANLRRPISRPLIHFTGMAVREGDTARAQESESRAVDLNSPGSSRGKSGEDYGAGNTEDRLLRAREIQRELGESRDGIPHDDRWDTACVPIWRNQRKESNGSS